MIKFSEELKKVLTDRRRDEKKVADNAFHCYYAGYCPRQIWFAKKNAKVFSVSVLGAMMGGTVIHSWMADTFRSLGGYEVPFGFHDKKLRIDGKADLVDLDTVYDFKTEASLRNLPTTDDGEGGLKSTYRKFHEYQLQLYMKGFNLKKGSLVYIDKTNFQVKQFEIEYDEELYTEIMDKYLVVRRKMNEDTNPFKKCACWQCEREEVK